MRVQTESSDDLRVVAGYFGVGIVQSTDDGTAEDIAESAVDLGAASAAGSAIAGCAVVGSAIAGCAVVCSAVVGTAAGAMVAVAE